MVLRKSFYIHWSAGRSPRVHEVNPGRDPSTTVPLQIKTDLSITDGINPEHKQEQRQPTKDAEPARRRRQQTSRRVRNDASQHGQGGGAPPHQPTPDRRVRATHQADATPAGGATNSRRS